MLGLSKVFIAILALATIVGYGTHNYLNFFYIVLMYGTIRIIYNVLS